MRGVRGAVCAAANSREAVFEATRKLLVHMQRYLATQSFLDNRQRCQSIIATLMTVSTGERLSEFLRPP